MYQNQRPQHGQRNGKPEVYAKEVLPSFVPGDIIKERVEEKPSLPRLKELVGKRYRFKPEDQDTPIYELVTAQQVDDAMSMATLREGVDYLVKCLLIQDGSVRNLIMTAAEVNADKVYQNKKMILITILNDIHSGKTRPDILISVSRQLAMRKLSQYRADPVVTDITNTMIQMRLIEVVQSGKVVKYNITVEGMAVLHLMKSPDPSIAKDEVDSIKVYQNFMPQ